MKEKKEKNVNTEKAPSFLTKKSLPLLTHGKKKGPKLFIKAVTKAKNRKG